MAPPLAYHPRVQEPAKSVTPNRLAACLGLLGLQATPAAADVLIPAGAALLGTLFDTYLVPAILLVETLVARRVLRLDFLRSLVIVATANLVSTVVGEVLSVFLLPGVGKLERDASLLLVFCVPALALSAWIEARVAAALLRKTHTLKQCARWSIEANLASYAMIAVVLLLIIKGLQDYGFTQGDPFRTFR
jgi:hypothetical protein